MVKNLLKAYLKALGPAFSFFQRSFKAIFEHFVGLGLATDFLCTDNHLGLKSNKWDIFERFAQLIMFFTTSDFANNFIKELSEKGFIGLSGFQLATLIFKHRQVLKDKSDIINKILQ